MSVHGTARGSVGFVNWHVNTCPECGKRFARNPNSVYGACCSYTCFRIGDKARRQEAKDHLDAEEKAYYDRLEKARQKQAELYARRARQSEKRMLTERVKLCINNERAYHNKMLTLKRGTREYRNAQRSWYEWKKKRLAAQEALEKAKGDLNKGEQNEQKVL